MIISEFFRLPENGGETIGRQRITRYMQEQQLDLDPETAQHEKLS
jgi:hypothetical protein